MSTAMGRPPALRRIPRCLQTGNRQKPQTKTISQAAVRRGILMSAESARKEKESFHELDAACSAPDLKISCQSELRFNKVQPSECDSRFRRDFGCFIAREAILDEELWTAAWLRAESHWEDQPNMRYVESYKRKFAEQEFTALKRRCSAKLADKCTCIVAVKKERKDIKRTVLNSIVGTLDVSIQHLLQGETFPGEHVVAPVFSSIYQTDTPKYGYVANLCVAKYARHQGIATNMLYLAVEAARSYGVDQMYVHVNKDNIHALQLYEKLGFQIIPTATSLPSEEQRYLLHFQSVSFLQQPNVMYKGHHSQ